jgi:hypothetical protein
MADTNRVEAETYQASGDMSALQHRFVDYVADGVIGHSLANGGIGVLQNKPQDTEFATVALRGRVRVDAGVAITAGDYIVSAASGFAAVQTASTQIASGAVLTNRVVMGRAMTAAASGSVFTLELNPTYTVVQSI